jgi:MerR family transcriptional regulator, thiopeptide resistance regulator
MNEFKHEDYEAEVKQRWGDTDAYKESKRRTAGYTPQDWDVIKKEAGDLFVALADLMTAGKAPTEVAAMDLAEAHRKHLERWFYQCPKSLHRSLGEGYVTDVRFTTNIDKIRTGLSRYLSEAFRANAERA